MGGSGALAWDAMLDGIPRALVEAALICKYFQASHRGARYHRQRFTQG